MSGPINGLTRELVKTRSPMEINLGNIIPRWYPPRPVAATASGYQAGSPPCRTKEIKRWNSIPPVVYKFDFVHF